MKNEYVKLISKLVDKFGQTIDVNDLDYNILIIKFDEYLKNVVICISESDSEFKFEKDYVENILIAEANRLINTDIDNKKSFLIEDEAFEKLRTISFCSFDYAIKKTQDKNIKLTEDIYDNLSKELDKLYELVKPYNKKEAEILRSEALLDIYYLFKENCEFTSLRFGRRLK